MVVLIGVGNRYLSTTLITSRMPKVKAAFEFRKILLYAGSHSGTRRRWNTHMGGTLVQSPVPQVLGHKSHYRMLLDLVGVGELSLYHQTCALPTPLDWRSGTNRVWPRMVAEQSTFNAASLQRSGAQPPGFCDDM